MQMERNPQWDQWNMWNNWNKWMKCVKSKKRRQRRRYRYTKQCPLEYFSESEFSGHFGFSKDHFRIILGRISWDLNGPRADAPHSLTDVTKLAIFLFWARGNIIQRSVW